MVRVASLVGVDLSTLDGLWWRAEGQFDENRGSILIQEEPGLVPPGDIDRPQARFGLKRHMQDFLRENWSYTLLGMDWNL